MNKIDILRKSFGSIDSISDEMYRMLTVFLDKQSPTVLRDLVDAKIKWVSSLALNRVKKIMPTMNEAMKLAAQEVRDGYAIQWIVLNGAVHIETDSGWREIWPSGADPEPDNYPD